MQPRRSRFHRLESRRGEALRHREPVHGNDVILAWRKTAEFESFSRAACDCEAAVAGLGIFGPQHDRGAFALLHRSPNRRARFQNQADRGRGGGKLHILAAHIDVAEQHRADVIVPEGEEIRADAISARAHVVDLEGAIGHSTYAHVRARFRVEADVSGNLSRRRRAVAQLELPFDRERLRQQVLQTDRCCYHSTLLPFLLESLQTAGPLRSTVVTRFPATMGPAETLSPSTNFPVFSGYMASLLRRFLDGTRRVSPVA